MSSTVIFLDIDGVICCNMAGRLEETKLLNLKEIIKATQAKVVLSTDWRRQANLKRQVVAALKRLDIEVIGATPMKPMFSPVRPVEITEWMAANAAKFEVGAWVAIDDRDLVNEQGGRELVGHFVHTHPASGLTKRLAEVAVGLLGGDMSQSLQGALLSPIAGSGEAAGGGFGKALSSLSNTAPAVMGGGAAAATRSNASGPGSPARRSAATPGPLGAAAAPSTLKAVRAVQPPLGSPPRATGLLNAASTRTPTRGAPSLTPLTTGGPLTKLRASSPPKRWSGAPLALGTEH